MSKIHFSSVVIEITRRCNMHCPHCLRGDAQALDIDTKYIDMLVENAEDIGTITFSGGEPSLNVDAIEYTLEQCKKHDVPVYGMYVVTNGKEVSERFLIAMLRWFAYVIQCGGDMECSGLALSKDKFHDPIPVENEYLLRSLGFFREDKFTDFDRYPIINEGRGAEATGVAKRPLGYSELEAEWENDGALSVYNDIYIGATGEVRTSCDASYANYSHTIGELNDSSLVDIIAAHIPNEEIQSA